MNIMIGRFFFRHRNWAFIPLYVLLFWPGQPVWPEGWHGAAVILGLSVTVAGQMLRALTISLAYIKRGGLNKQVYAESLVTEGLFAHCRNPLYVGNLLMLTGLGVISGSGFFLLLAVPAFFYIYHAIVVLEESYLQRHFGAGYEAYCQRVGRFRFRWQGLSQTLAGSTLNWRRWLIKESYGLFLWLSAIALLVLYRYPEYTLHDAALRDYLAAASVLVLVSVLAAIQYLRKTGKLTISRTMP